MDAGIWVSFAPILGYQPQSTGSKLFLWGCREDSFHSTEVLLTLCSIMGSPFGLGCRTASMPRC